MRLSLANEYPHFAVKALQGVLHYVRSFYYDTTLSPSPYAMATLRELIERDHILFGAETSFAARLEHALAKPVEAVGDRIRYR